MTNPHGYLTEPRWFTARAFAQENPMSWEPNDRWRDTYDAWKLASPDDEYPQEECWHEDYEADINGRATCCTCGEVWYLTAEQTRAERELNCIYDEICRAQERRERWDRLTSPFRWAWYRIMNRIWPRKSLMFLRDDEIPF